MPLEDPGDDGPNGPPPDPLDRLWVHPSELSARGRPPSGPPPRRRNRDWVLMLAAGATGALVATGALALAGVLGGERSGTATHAAAPVAVLAARAAPAIVAVVAVTASGEQRGSGVAIADGWVLATCETLGGAGSVTVASADGSQHRATVRGLDRTTDLALLHVNGVAGGLPMPTTDKVTVGEPVIAVGAGDGNHTWVATGVVSSVASGPTVSGPSGEGATDARLIATDALVDSGATGGMLLDARGRVVGVITTGPDRGGVAVPIAVARTVAGQLRRTGTVGHGWMGVAGGDALDLRDGGVRITEVAAGSPAARTGLRVDDVVVAVDGTRIRNMTDLVDEVRARRPGDRVAVGIRRGGTGRTLTLTLVDMPADPSVSTTSTTRAVATAGTLEPAAG